MVERVELLDRLVASQAPVISVVAPPGYGKSTLLSQWADRRGARVAWVSCDRIADDPVSLWMAAVAALTLIEPLPAASRELAVAEPRGVVQHLMDLLGALSQPVTLVFDQLEVVSSGEGQNLVSAFAMAVSHGSRLGLGSRNEVPVPAARMRVQHNLLEIGATDLAMSKAEASLLLSEADVALSGAETDRLLEQTEGWPAALCLAALAIRAGDTTADRGIDGNDRSVSDYLRSEMLEHIPRTEQTFLIRTSILERVNAELGNAVAGSGKGTRLLERLCRQNLLVVPLDSQGEWYRYHHLFRQMLQGELRRDSPDLRPKLHDRASRWFEAAGDLEAAIEHAGLAGDTRRFGRLVLEAMQPAWASGRLDIVEHWMERLGHRSPSAHTPAMIAHGALIFALLGQAGDAERWAAVAESLPAEGMLPDGSTVEATLAYLRANLCRDGVTTMRQDSLIALEGLGPASPYRATMLHTEGLSYLLEGNLEKADASFAHAYDTAISLDSPPVAALILTEQFIVAVAREDWTTAYSLIKRSLEIVSRGPFDVYWTSALVYACAAHAATHRGDMPEARKYVRRAARLRPLLTYALPVVSVQALLEMGRTYLALIDPAGVRAVLDQIRGIVQQRPELGSLVTDADQLGQHISRITAAAPFGASSLTTAELRLVPLLPTRLTMPEIGERLFISRHTVKSQAISLYRKLGVSSRDEAVERMIALGLL